MSKPFATILVALIAIVSIAQAGTIVSAPWGETKSGTPVQLFTLKNEHGMIVKISNYGAIVTSVVVPDRDGKFADVALGYSSVKDYIKSSPYFGAVVGRYGNRIRRGHFTLDGKVYTLYINNGVNSLHGGKVGFDKRVWNPTTAMVNGVPTLILEYVSPDGEEGYPGDLTLTVIYSLLSSNTINIDYTATTDKDTVLNPTNHTYWNLSGEGSPTILDHIIRINASHFTPIDPTSIPLGKNISVAGTPFDFRKPTAIGLRINEKNTQLINGKGYDHNWVLDRKNSGDVELAADVYDPMSGRDLQVWTTQPGLQFYSGNFLNGTLIGKSGRPYRHRSALALEAQHYPDSPNRPNFPSTELKPGDTYHEVTQFRLSTR